MISKTITDDRGMRYFEPDCNPADDSPLGRLFSQSTTLKVTIARSEYVVEYERVQP